MKLHLQLLIRATFDRDDAKALRLILGELLRAESHLSAPVDRVQMLDCRSLVDGVRNHCGFLPARQSLKAALAGC